MRARYVVPLVVFVVIGAFFAYGLTQDPSKVPSPLVGKPIPNFELTAVHDPERTVSPQQFRGEVWLLNVWATWCVACREEHPVLMAAAERNELQIVGLDYKDKRPSAVRWLDQHGNPYMISAFDAEGTAGLDLGVYGVPETYVIDRKGIIRYKHIGPLSHDTLREKILPLVTDLRGENA